MSFDQFVIAILGHLAWRTPFAEDCGPVEERDPSPPPRSEGAMRSLPQAVET